MNRLIPECKTLFLTILLFLIAINVLGAPRYSVATGNWSATSTWSATSGGASGASVPVAGDNVFIESGYTITVTANAACTNITFTNTGATLTVNSTVTLTVSGTVTLDNLATGATTCTITGSGTLSCASVAVGSPKNTPAGLISYNSHTLTCTIATLIISGNLAVKSYNSGLNFRNGVFNLASGIATVEGSVTTANANVLNSSTFSMATGVESGTLILSGTTPFNLSGTGINTLHLDGASSLVNYNYSGAQTAYGTPYTNLTLAGSGAKTVTGVTVNGILSMEGTSTAAGTAPTFGTAAVLQYKGSASQTTGIEFPATFTSSGGVVIDNANGVTLNSNRTINVSLTFNNGIITTGANTLILASGTNVIGAGTGKYIFGNLQKGIGAGTVSIIFETGDASVYAPVLMTFTGTTNGAGSITAKTTSGDHPNIGTSTFSTSATVNRYWTLTNSGVSGFTGFSTTFSFVAGDIDADADFNYFYIGNYNTPTWTYPSVGTGTATSTQATGMTTFGDFQIGHSLVNSFRSMATGNWNQNSTWENYNAGAWGAAASTPTSASGIIFIRLPYTVTNTTVITVDQVIINTGATLTLSSSMTLADGPGTDMIIEGTIDCGSAVALSGAGSFAMSNGSNLIIRSTNGITSSGASGNIQTAIRTYNTNSNYSYSGTAAQVTGNGLPATVNNLTIDNTTGVSLSGSVTSNGIVNLTTGALNIAANNLTFQNSNTPIVRTAGTITTSTSSNIAFGTPGNTGGTAFTLPAGTFTTAPIINNLTLYRDNSLNFNDQVISIGGILLCNAPLNTNGKLTLLSTAAGTALINGSSTGSVNGNVTMQRYLPSGFGYKYFSSPFQAATVNEFSDDMTLGSFTFYRYDESRTSSGWVSYDNPTTNPLIPLQGYAVNFGSGSSPNTVDITGAVNNGSLSVTLYNNNNTYTKGFNLVGNPYPSPIDWNAAGWTKTNIEDALYFFKASITDQYGGTYSSWVGGVSNDGSLNMNIIPSMQGFFVHITDGPPWPVTGTLAMNNNVRIFDLNHSFTKSKGVNLVPLIRLTSGFSDDIASEDPVVIYFDEKATPDFDTQLDARKLLNTDWAVANLYAVNPDGAKLSISALAPISDNLLQVPLGLKLNRDGNIIFRIRDVDETLTGMRIYLSDIVAGIDQDLLPDKEYSVSMAAGEYSNRFFLNFSSVATGIKDNSPKPDLFSIYSTKGILKAEINYIEGEEGTLKIYNLLGQAIIIEDVYEKGYHEFNRVIKNGIYIVSYTTGSKMSSKKIIIQNP